ncbi:MAG: hypothetical protein NTU97_00780 [Candidatus Magasanikbacteria bacterium]|nr:hypothetical protein [Candidatus Magasanikbacteria bacterium]
MKRNIVVAVLAACLFTPTLVQAEEAKADPAMPKVTLTVAEGYTLLFKDGVTPGTASTRFMVGLGWKLDKGFGVSVGGGVSIPNTEVKPSPRVSVGVSYSLTDTLALVVSGLYQYNPSYTGKPDSHLLAVGTGLTYKINQHFSIGLDVSPAKVLEGGLWSLLFQPRVSYTF